MQETVLATPPRAWGRLSTLCHPGRGQGNTPTSVGKTCGPWRPCSSRRKHPHERGEDAAFSAALSDRGETPPRAWGRRVPQRRRRIFLRNTPTSVGKTARIMRTMSPSEKHPHERGEDTGPCWPSGFARETPPRAWGRPYARKIRHILQGKHPHERGEDPC